MINMPTLSVLFQKLIVNADAVNSKGLPAISVYALKEERNDWMSACLQCDQPAESVDPSHCKTPTDSIST